MISSKTILAYPTLDQVQSMDRYELCRYHRFLRSPENDQEVEVNKLLYERWQEAGGFTPEISKSLGW